MNRITQLSRSSQGRSLIGQVQERLAGGGERGRGRSSRRRSAGRAGRRGRRMR